MPITYNLKQSDVNPDLKFSLRSVEKFCTFRNIWVVGYKPNWVKNVNYLPTVQSGNKWVNSMTNIVAACNCPEISEDFVLMNDDFFMLRSITDWRKTFNLCLNTIDEEAKKYENKNPSRWQYGFLYAKELLDALHCEKRYNWEHNNDGERKKYSYYVIKCPCCEEESNLNNYENIRTTKYSRTL